MAGSTSDTLFDAIVQTVDDLALSLDGVRATVVKRKGEEVKEGIDEPSLPLITVTGSGRPNKSVLWDTGRDDTERKKNDYLFGLGFAWAGNRDNLSGLAMYQEWRHDLMRAFGNPRLLQPSGGGGVLELPEGVWLYDIEIDPASLLDRVAARSLFDHSQMVLEMVVIEPAV